LYRVLVQGEGFELPIEGSNDRLIGFFTTRFVAACSRLEAESLAQLHVVREWQGLSLMSYFTGTDEPCLSVIESEAIEGWFRPNKGQGFSFYGADTTSEGQRSHENAV